MSKKWLPRILVGAALIAGSSLIAASPANAQTASPDGFGPCTQEGMERDLTKLPEARGNDGVDIWSSYKGTIGPRENFDVLGVLFGPTEVQYLDRIVIDEQHSRYIHLREIVGEPRVEVQGCKPKSPDDTPADAPRLEGSGFPLDNLAYVNHLNNRRVISYFSSVPDPIKYGEVGPVEPADSVQ